MTTAADIETLLDATRDAARALAEAEEAVREASLVRAAAEKIFLLKQRQLNEFLTKVVNLAERGAEWRNEGDDDGRISSTDRPIPWVRGSDPAPPIPAS